MTVERTPERGLSEDRLERTTRQIMEERTPSPEQVIYRPTIEFLDPEGQLSREERGRVIAMGDRTAISYRNLGNMVIEGRGKTVEVEGEVVGQTQAFYLMYSLAARSNREIAHTSILEQMGVGIAERGGDSPIVLEGVSILAGLRDVCALRHFGFEAFSSRGGIFPEGYWGVPGKLIEAGIGEELEAVNREVYAIYLQLTRAGVRHYLSTIERREGEKQWQYRWRVLNLALDDSRQVTNGSWLNHFSMHANSALSLREGIVKLASSELPETREIARRLRALAEKGLPTLMRHTDPSPFTQSLPARRQAMLADLGLDGESGNRGQVKKSRLLSCSVINEDAAREFLAAFLSRGGNTDFQTALVRLHGLSDEQIKATCVQAFRGIELHDKPPEELEVVQLVARFEMSLGAIYEAIRHRLITHNLSELSPYHGYTIPDIYRELGLERDYVRAIELNERAYDLIARLGPQYRVFAPYFVTRAHLVPITMRMSGLDAFHMIKIRASESAHPDIKGPLFQLEHSLRESNPAIFGHLVKK